MLMFILIRKLDDSPQVRQRASPQLALYYISIWSSEPPRQIFLPRLFCKAQVRDVHLRGCLIAREQLTICVWSEGMRQLRPSETIYKATKPNEHLPSYNSTSELF